MYLVCTCIFIHLIWNIISQIISGKKEKEYRFPVCFTTISLKLQNVFLDNISPKSIWRYRVFPAREADTLQFRNIINILVTPTRADNVRKRRWVSRAYFIPHAHIYTRCKDWVTMTKRGGFPSRRFEFPARLAVKTREFRTRRSKVGYCAEWLHR